MARLVDVRLEIVAAPADSCQEPAVSAAQVHPFEASLLIPLSCRRCGQEERLHTRPEGGGEPEPVTEGESDWGFDDDDFWEALDLMETSCKIMQSLLTTCRMSPERHLAIENHCCDLKQFIDEFLIHNDGEER